MIICPNCQSRELNGSLFCSECGAQLVVPKVPTTHSIERNQTGLFRLQTRPLSPPSPVTPSTAAQVEISLHLVQSGMILHLSDKKEYTLGRIADGQTTLPDVDFSPYEAYAQGVSRLHAVLKINNQRVFLRDLGSSNGTRVNGQKISPNQDYLLNHGDIVVLGRFKIQVLIRK